jgi:hypothetical protein
MATATRVAGDKEGEGEGIKGDGDGDEGGGRRRGRGRLSDGDGDKGDERATVTRVAGKVLWQWQQGRSRRR